MVFLFRTYDPSLNREGLFFCLFRIHHLTLWQRLPQFLIVERVGSLPPPALSGVVGVDGLFPKHGFQLLQRGRLFAAQEDGGIHVADDGIGVVLVDGLELALRLQHQTGRDFSTADGGDQLLQLGDLANVGALINKAPHMNRQPPAVHIIGFFAEQVEQLGVAHGDQEVKAIVRIAHNQEQCGSPVAQGVQLQLIVGCDLPQLGNVEHRQPCAAAYQNRLRGFARNELSRTF